jgi:Zn-dependent protease with chaperone function
MNEADNIFTGGAYEGDDDSVATMGTITASQFSLKFESEAFTLDLPTHNLEVDLDEKSRVIFTHPNYPGWKIYSLDPKILYHRSLHRFGALKKKLEQLQYEHAGPSKHAVRVYKVLGAITACLIGLWLFSDAILGLIVNTMPASWEVKVGDAAFKEMQDEVMMTTDPILTARLNPVVERLKRGLPYGGPKFEFYIASDPLNNAIALPNGKVIVMSGLLEEADPEELAGVLAHEMSHVLKRHGMRALAQMQGASLIATYIFGGEGALADFTELSSALGGLKYSRDNERQADKQAFDILIRANIDPRGLTRFFRQMRREEAQALDIPDVFNTHPPTTERIQTLEQLWEKNPKKSGYQPVQTGPAPPKSERSMSILPILQVKKKLESKK